MSNNGAVLIYGDSMDFMRSKPAISVDAIITDPPYDGNGSFVTLAKRLVRGNMLVFCKPENQYFVPDEYLFWIKPFRTMNYSKHCGRFVEMILVKRGKTFNLLHWPQMTGVYFDALVDPPVHPHEKPISLIERLIRIYTNPGDLIFDPFMGSGVVGMAAKRLGRRFIGVENELEWFSLAEERINNCYEVSDGQAHD